MGDYLGITESNYRRIEYNQIKSISLNAIATLCKVLNCTPNDLFEIDETAEA
jgi:putative transcriptional regulator